MKTTRLQPVHLMLFVLIGAGLMIAMDRDQIAGVEDRITQAVEIIRFGDQAGGLARFDTSNGAISRFNGDASHPSGTVQWVAEVKGVGHAAPGTFRLQHTSQPGLFLVNVASGETWILQERAGENFGWLHIRDVH